MTEVAEFEKVRFSETGLTIAPFLSFNEWMQLGDTLKRMDRAVQWWIGDWLLHGESTYSETYTQALEATSKEYATLANYKWVAKHIEPSRRRENLSWGVHRELAALPEDAQEAAFKAAEEAEGWSVRDARKYVKKLKGGDEDEPEDPLCATCPYRAPAAVGGFVGVEEAADQDAREGN